VLVFMFLLELGFSRAISFFTTLLFGFGTAVFVGAHEFFQHPLETLLLLGTIYVLVGHRADLRARHALMAGALLGFGMLTRVDLVITIPALSVYLLAVTRNAHRDGDAQRARAPGSFVVRLLFWAGLHPIDTRPLRNLCAFALPIALAAAAVLALNYVKYESALNFGVAQSTTSSGAAVPNTHFSLSNALVGLDGFLLSPGRSIFLYSPPVILGLIGARRFYSLRRAEALLFGAVACTYALFYASQDLWHGGLAWGPRYLLPAIPLLIISAAHALERRRAVLVAVGLGMAGFLVQVLGTVENVSYVRYAHAASVPRGSEADLFVPQISPVPTHLQDMLANRNVDLWLAYVWDQFGTRALLLTLAVPASILAAAILLLRDVARQPGARSETARGDDRLASATANPIRIDIEPTAAKTPALPHHFYSLDALRGVAALVVVFWHWQHFFFIRGTGVLGIHRAQQPLYSLFVPFYTDGWRAVDLFFCLSGFIFYWLYSERIWTRETSLREFVVLRFSRLYPLHLLTLLFVLAAQPVMRWLTGSVFVYAHNDPYHFVLQLLLASNWAELNSSFNGPIWSVSVEILAYALFCLLCLRNLRSWWHLAILAGIGLQLTRMNHPAHFDPTLVGRGMLSFFAGGMAFHVFSRAWRRTPSHATLMTLAVATSLLWMLMAANIYAKDALGHYVFNPPAKTFEFLLFPITLVTLALWEARRGTLGKRVAFLGHISYSSYLLHFPLQMVFVAVAVELPVPRTFFLTPYALMLFFATLIAVSLCSYYYFERPVQSLLRKRLLRRAVMSGVPTGSGAFLAPPLQREPIN